MAIYEKFIGRTRDSFVSLRDCRENYKITYGRDFNFAYDVMDVLGTEKPDKLAMLWISKNGEEKRFTFGDFKRLSDRAANYFSSVGVKKGDATLLVMRRSYLFWIVSLALNKIGAVMVPASYMLTAKDYLYRCDKANIKYVVLSGDGEYTELFDGAKDKYKTVKMKFATDRKRADGWIDLEAELEKTEAAWTRPTGENAVNADDTMLINFSSGTVGYPKIITHDFKYPLGHIATGVFWHRVEDGGVHFAISDSGWAKALWGKYYGQWFGEAVVMVYDFDKFNGADILSKIEKYRVSTFCVPPTMYRMLLQYDVSKYDLSSLTHCCTAGEPLNADIFNKWKKATGLEIYEGFGMSETPVTVCSLYPWTKPVPGAIGFPAPGLDVHILDEEGNHCQRGTVGEICIAAPSPKKRPCGVLTGYNFSAEDSARAFRGGFFHTGDLAYRDEKGRFVFYGRNDDIIKSSGYRIGPFEVESVMLEHPAVLEVGVTGVPDPVRGFVVKATVVLRRGFEGSPELVKELQNYVKANTAPYKYPRIIEFADRLPKTFNGKIRRSVLREDGSK